MLPPAHEAAEPAPAAFVTLVPRECVDSSSEDDMPLQDMKFVQGCAEHGDAVDFTKSFSRYVRSCRMSDYSLLKQVYACAAVCDEVTEAAIEAQILHATFPQGGRNRQFERGAVADGVTPAQIDAANARVGTLTQFLEWFRATFQRQDAEVEAREQVE